MSDSKDQPKSVDGFDLSHCYVPNCRCGSESDEGCICYKCGQETCDDCGCEIGIEPDIHWACDICVPQNVPNTSTATISSLLDRMAKERGRIVCSSSCTVVEIAEARADQRFAVMDDGIGFVYVPELSVSDKLQLIADAPITKELNTLRECKAAIDRGGWDISPCRLCNELVVCIPDGLPMCESCGTSEGT